jgi:uroporphyrinogen decarboxylase
MGTAVFERYGRVADYRTLPLSEMQAIVSRFEERVNVAQLANPVTKESVKKAISRAGAQRCPVRLNRLSMDVIIRYGDALADLFCLFPDDLVLVQAYEFTIGYQTPNQKDHISSLQALMQAGEWTDEWGTRWGHAFGGVGATPVQTPIRDWSQLDDYLANRMPDPHASGRLDSALRALAIHGETKYCVGAIHMALFERLHALRGMENVLADLCTFETEICRLCEALTHYLIELIREWGKTNVSAIYLTDDWGSQTGIMISPKMWRRYFKVHYRRIFEEIHRFGKGVFFHSCGNIMDIIPDLIDLGVDVVDPIQPGAMDLNEVARKFGGRTSFSGGIDAQRLENCTAEEVKHMVRGAIATLGRPFGNGYVVSPANLVVPSVPFENLQALFEACHEQ